MEVIEVQMPYNTCGITALMPTRVIFDAPDASVGATKPSATKRNIDRPEPSCPFRPARS